MRSLLEERCLGRRHLCAGDLLRVPGRLQLLSGTPSGPDRPRPRRRWRAAARGRCFARARPWSSRRRRRLITAPPRPSRPRSLQRAHRAERSSLPQQCDRRDEQRRRVHDRPAARQHPPSAVRSALRESQCWSQAARRRVIPSPARSSSGSGEMQIRRGRGSPRRASARSQVFRSRLTRLSNRRAIKSSRAGPSRARRRGRQRRTGTDPGTPWDVSQDINVATATAARAQVGRDATRWRDPC